MDAARPFLHGRAAATGRVRSERIRREQNNTPFTLLARQFASPVTWLLLGASVLSENVASQALGRARDFLMRFSDRHVEADRAHRQTKGRDGTLGKAAQLLARFVSDALVWPLDGRGVLGISTHALAAGLQVAVQKPRISQRVMMAQSYRGTKIATAATHCDSLVRLSRDAAKEANAAATMHKDLAGVAR